MILKHGLNLCFSTLSFITSFTGKWAILREYEISNSGTRQRAESFVKHLILAVNRLNGLLMKIYILGGREQSSCRPRSLPLRNILDSMYSCNLLLKERNQCRNTGDRKGSLSLSNTKLFIQNSSSRRHSNIDKFFSGSFWSLHNSRVVKHLLKHLYFPAFPIVVTLSMKCSTNRFLYLGEKTQQGVKKFNNPLHFEEERGKRRFTAKALFVTSGVHYTRVEAFK